MGDMESLIDDLLMNIKSGREHTFDFFQDVNQGYDIAKVISAFSNTIGGRIVFGVKDNGKIIGVYPEEAISSMNEILMKFNLTKVKITLKGVQVKYHMIVVCDIEAGLIKYPVRRNTESIYYVRIGVQTIVANKIVVKAWSMSANTQFELSSFSSELLKLLENKEVYSLAKLYKQVPGRNSEIDLALSLLLSIRKIEIYAINKEIKYRISTTKSLN